jgi:hypothetical protein
MPRVYASACFQRFGSIVPFRAEFIVGKTTFLTKTLMEARMTSVMPCKGVAVIGVLWQCLKIEYT